MIQSRLTARLVVSDMDANLWSLYLRLQTDIAYGTSLGEVNQAAIAAALSYADRLSKVSPPKMTLVIGPGGPEEVLALRETLGGRVYALTAHYAEYEAMQARGMDGCEVSVGDMHDLPYDSGVFDFIMASNVLEHAFAPYIALLECRRVLVDGGVAYFILPMFGGREGGRNPFHLHCLTTSVWLELLRKVGLMVTDCWEVVGDADPTGGYLHFVTSAGKLPVAHAQLLSEIITHKAIKRAMTPERTAEALQDATKTSG